MGRQRPGHRTPCAELLRRPLRPVAAATSLASLPPALGNGRALSPADQAPVSRRNFVELCRQLTELDERAYAQAWQRLGLSVDWDVSYRTIDDRVQAVSQLAFLRNLARGEAYQAEAPALWDVTFGTAVAQAEIEDRETPGTFIRLAFAHTDRARHGTG